jgi:hypothetical protein
MAARLGLRVPEADIVDVREDLIANTDDMVMQLGCAPCKAGKQLGSRYPGKPAETACFAAHRVLGKLEQRVGIEGFTQPGDPMRLDYGYQNGVRGFIHSVSLRRDISQAKVLAYTAECIHARDALAQITAITEVEPAGDNPRHQFVERLFAEQKIRIVPMNLVESFAEELRTQLNFLSGSILTVRKSQSILPHFGRLLASPTRISAAHFPR